MARLSHLFLLTSNLAAQRRLFVDLLGLEVLAEYPGYVRVGGGGGFDIGMEEGEPGPPNAVEITIEVPNVDAAFATLVAAGVAVEGPPADQEWGARHGWFRDVDGRRLSVFTRPV